MSAGGEHTRAGRVLGGRYRLTERIGSGGMGTVWRAYDEVVQREVAVKQPRLPGDPEDERHRRAAKRLYREARAAARVDHPSAVAIHDVVVEEDGLPWIVMELVRGESLHEALRRGPVGAPEAARIGLAVLGALCAAHCVGIVHRDVKPANVLLGSGTDRVVLTDFGIAHIQGEESLTVSGEFVGSLEFVAPERMSGSGAGPASDLWSLGVLLYAAVEGWSPFRRTTVESTLAAIITADVPEPKKAGPLGPLIARLLVKDPERRPGAQETGAVLEAVAQGWPVPEPEMTTAQGPAGLRESGEEVGTLRRGAAPAPPPPEPARSPQAPAEPAPEPVAQTGSGAGRRPLLRRPAPLALLGALLVGGGWLGASCLSYPDAVTERTATYRSAPARSTPAASASPAPGTWIAHREKQLDAVLALPAAYEQAARKGGAADRPRLVVYGTGHIQVRLTEWDRAPGDPLEQAKKAFRTWKGHSGDASGSSTRTTFRGLDAAVADTTYGPRASPTRVMQLFVVTGDDRMYELRVDMPKGTPGEKKGAALFRQTRARLRIEEDRPALDRPPSTP